MVLRQHLRRLLEQVDRLEQQVVEVERVGRREPLAVALGEAGDHPLAVVDGVLGEERLVEHLVLRPADRAEDRGRPELAGRRQVLLGQDPLHQLLLVVRVVDDEPAVEPDRLAVPAEHARAQRVERARLDVLAVLADEAR